DAAVSGELGALVVAGVEVDDLPDPARAREALDAVPFLVSLELRPSEATERAGVVLPVAAVAEEAGTFLNWEGRARMFEAAIKPDQMTRTQLPPDARVLHMLADAMATVDGDCPAANFALPDLQSVRAELTRLGAWDGPLPAGPVARA